MKASLLYNGIPLLKAYLTSITLCKPFDPDWIKELCFDPSINIGFKKQTVKDYLLFAVIFNYGEMCSTWQCNLQSSISAYVERNLDFVTLVPT